MFKFKGLGLVVFLYFFAISIEGSEPCGAHVYRLASQTYENGVFPRVLAVGFHSAEVAEFQPGSADEILKIESELAAKGVSAIVLVEPTPDDLAKLTLEKGFHFGPLFATWHKPVQTLEDEIAGRADLSEPEKKKRIADYYRKLKKSENFAVTVEQLTEANFDEFFKLYMDTTVNAGVTGLGTPTVVANHTKPDGATKGDLSNWRVILIRDPFQNNLLVGGLLVELFPTLELAGSTGIAKIKTAGYRKTDAYEKAQLSHRAQDELLKLSLELKMQILSHGSDPNFFGEMVGVGLAAYKRAKGYIPLLGNMYPGPLGVVLGKKRILKVLRPEDFRNPKTGEQQYLIFDSKAGGELKPVLSGNFPADYIFQP